MSHGEQKSCGCTKIKWGAVLAGAAIAAGAVLFAPGMPEIIGNAVQGIAEIIKGLFSSGAPSVGGSAIGEKITEALFSPVTRAAVGLGLMGGGAAYFMGQGGAQEHEHLHDLARQNRRSFVDAENTRLMQGKMIIQAAHAGNPQAQAMLAQMQGRGC